MTQAKKIQNHVRLALKVSSGLDEGTFFQIKKRRNIIGRRMGASVPVEDVKVSRDHAAIDFTSGSYFLIDLGSKNGTFINNEKVKKARKVNIGDEIRIGSCSFKVALFNTAKKGPVNEKFDSDTKLINLSDLVTEKPEHTKKRWKYLNPHAARRISVSKDHLRLVVLGLSAMLVLVALLTQFNAFA